MATRIIIDPGHGGFDSGAVFGQRKEKDDNLRLALATGEQLEKAGYTVIYTRTEDRYDSPYEKAQIANNAGGDLFLSFHRNSSARTDLYHGVQALVYDEDPLAVRVAENVNAQLEKVGFDNLGIEQRKELVVLRRTTMPAVLLEVGFINSNKDNQLFDEKFDEIANAIAMGVEESLPLSSVSAKQLQEKCIYRDQNPGMTDRPVQEPSMEPHLQMQRQPMESQTVSRRPMTPPQPDERPMPPMMPSQPDERPMPTPPSSMEPVPAPKPMPVDLTYYVQVGLFRYPENAVYLMEQLKQQDYDSVWKRVAGLIAVWVGPVDSLDEAAELREELQRAGYDTLIVSDKRQN